MLEARIGFGGAQHSFSNTPAGMAQLAAFCRDHRVDLVAMEATGGYERQAFAQLWEQDLPVAILNPRQVRRFADAMGLLEKTDALDAGLIAQFAEVRNSQPTEPVSASRQQLRGLVTRLRQLTELHTAQSNQSRLVTDRPVLEMFDELLTVLKRQQRVLEQQIATLIAADPLWRQLNTVFREIKGVADRTVARLMAEMPEIGTLSHKSISKLAGVAPLANDSGKHQGKRSIRGGRSSVREILYVIAGLAARYEPDFQAFRERLLAAGKPLKVIRIALAHKLLVRLNAKARDVRKELAHPSHCSNTTAVA